MATSAHPLAPHHLPGFITAPGETDVLFSIMTIVVVGSIVLLGVFYFKLHALPEHMAHKGQKFQYELVAVLALLSLFTHNHVFWIAGLLLPWLVIGVSFSTQYARFSRGSMIDSLNEDYVRTARAKGLSDRRVTLKHALRAAIVPIVTIFGLDFAGLLAGTVFTEQIFSIQGIGLAGLQAIGNKDLPVISATVLISATFIVVANLLVDLFYSVIDPRVRLT